ncbi:hypothetical protein BZA77DRAFT_386088 [Pyronema omphalodes]|nr:hypothetical protein BZA77DRAFT_386088 [Pyronema omphalodes]
MMLRAFFLLLGLAYGSTASEATTTTTVTTHTTTTTTVRETATTACKLTQARTVRTINFHEEFKHPEIVLKHAAANADELSPGKGYVVQKKWDDHPPFNILLENGHAWEVVNCTETFAVGTPEAESCLPHNYALSYRPAMGDFPIGIVGTTGYITFPRPGSPWGVFDLQSIVVTPFDRNRNLTGVPIMVSVYMWVLSDEGFIYPMFHDQQIVGGLPQYEIKLKEGALPITKFQVLAWETNREQEAPIEGVNDSPKTLGMILHSMSFNEFTHGTEVCPTGPIPGTNNELFRKIPNWLGKFKNDLQQPEDSNLKFDFNQKMRMMTIQAKNFFFAVNSLKLKIGRNIPQNERLMFRVQSYDTCGNMIPQSDPFIKWEGGAVEITFVHEGHRQDKVFKMEIMIPENIWEPKELEIREWFDVLGLPGCHPCAEENQKLCEVPVVRRLLAN